MAHLDEHTLLSDKQHAFRKWHSCETQLATVINDWAKTLDNKGQVDTFILDFEKAFDVPPHKLLKNKLFSYGIGELFSPAPKRNGIYERSCLLVVVLGLLLKSSR